MRKRFWVLHLLAPLTLLATLLSIIGSLNADVWVARQWFFDPARGWWGQGLGTWWARDLLHTGGTMLVRVVALLMALVWLAGVMRDGPWRKYRRHAGYIALSMVIASVTVGLLKHWTNIDCPWDLRDFGGTRPYLGLFDPRPASLPRGQCFPGAHSGSGFALFSLYFAAAGSNTLRRWLGLAAGATVGGLFAFAQEARGAHFLSHDLTSAAIAWMICASLYYWVFLRTAPGNQPSIRIATSRAEPAAPSVPIVPGGVQPSPTL